jgi:hypothetical protein
MSLRVVFTLIEDGDLLSHSAHSFIPLFVDIDKDAGDLGPESEICVSHIIPRRIYEIVVRELVADVISPSPHSSFNDLKASLPHTRW